MISWMIAFGILIGTLDTLAGNRFGVGVKFQQGIRLIGSLMISMAGIMALVPVIASWLQPVALPVFQWLNMDPGMLAVLMGNDMGGYQLAMSLAENQKIGVMAGGITAGMLGVTLNFGIPMGFEILDKKDLPYFSKGILLGIGSIPVGSIMGGLLLDIPWKLVLWNNVPVLILTICIVVGFIHFQNGMVKIMEKVGKFVEWIGMLGIGVGSFTYLTGVEIIPGMTPIMETMGIVCSVTITMMGMFPVLEVFTKVFRPLLYKAGERMGIGIKECSGLIFTMASSAPVFSMMRGMTKKGIVINAAWIVGCAAVFGSQMGMLMGINKEYLMPFIVGKLCTAFVGLAAALFYTRGWKEEEEVPSAEINEM